MMGERSSTERKDQIEDFVADRMFDLATNRGNGWNDLHR